MGVIESTSTDRFGKTVRTEVRTNRFEDRLINTIGRCFGRGREWRLVHRVEKRKLKRQ